ncbi:MAG: nucleoside transporter C-terminal domain-containing protein [Pseudomonadota bacterium]|nr:nucleoside transporter C-terminal domain-containing protein [Pseudomonadota bacterium]
MTPAALQAGFGLVVMIGLAWAISENRRAMPWRAIMIGLTLQFVLAFALLKFDILRAAFLSVNDVVAALQGATRAGTSFVFGYLGGGDLPFKPGAPGAAFVLALQALPLVLLMSALSALLYHWRILPLVVRGFAWALGRALNVGGAASVGAVANIFVGMVEAPLLVRPYLARLGRGDLFLIMTAGMATIAGTMLVLYASFLGGVIPDPVSHLLTASVLSAPAAVAVARVMVPAEREAVSEKSAIPIASMYESSMDAVVTGTFDGLRLLLNIVAMLIVLVALVHLANAILGLLPDVAGAPVTLQGIFGLVLSPLAWLTGIPWHEARIAGMLLGEKIVLNELIAYLSMARLPPDALGAESKIIMTYALCGFANFASLGIMIGGLGAMAPDRCGEIVVLGPRSIAAGVLATCMTGAVVGIIV